MAITKKNYPIKNIFIYIGLSLLMIVMFLILGNWETVKIYLQNWGINTKRKTMEVSKLPFISKVKENVNEFGLKVIEIALKLGTDAAFLMIIMNNESGLNSKAKNPNSSATGLIQFMHDTAISLGTTADKLIAMSNVDQLDYVYKYLKPFIGHYKTVSDVYLAVFFPKALFENEDYVFPLWASKANPNFDLNKDGIGTKKEFRQYVNKKYAKYLV